MCRRCVACAGYEERQLLTSCRANPVFPKIDNNIFVYEASGATAPGAFVLNNIIIFLENQVKIYLSEIFISISFLFLAFPKAIYFFGY